MKLAKYLTNSFFREGIISEEDMEIVRFGLESLIGNLLGIALILTIGISFGHVSEAILLWVFWFLLRKNAGGFHAKTKIGCLLISTGILIVSFTLFVVLEYTMIFYLLCSLITGSVIWLMAPVDNSTKQLDLVEFKVYRRRTKILLCLEEVILLVALVFEITAIIKSVNMAFFIVSVTLLLGRVKNIC